MTIASLAAHFDDKVAYRIYSGSGMDMEIMEEGTIRDIYNQMQTVYLTTQIDAWHVSFSGTLQIYIK